MMGADKGPDERARVLSGAVLVVKALFRGCLVPETKNTCKNVTDERMKPVEATDISQ